MRDLYQILGIRRAAPREEIQKAYRRKAKTLHPDGGGSVEAFAELSTAYTILSDAKRRERYDTTGEIEPERPDNLDVSAIEIIAQKLGLIIHAEHDVVSADIDALIEQAIRQDIAERTAGISSLKRASDRARKLRERVKRRKNGGDNTLARVLEWHEITVRGHIKKNEEAVGAMERALEILKDYSFAEELSPVSPDEVSSALHDALDALDQLSALLNSHRVKPAVQGEPSPTAYG